MNGENTDNQEYTVLLNNIRKSQLVILEIFDYFDCFCKKHGLKYFLYGGTLLGAVRHKGFIPWDDDFDVIMPYNDYYIFLAKMREEIDAENYFLQEENSLSFPLYYTKLRKNGTFIVEKIVYKNNFKNIHEGLFIDIFCLDSGAPTRLGRWNQYFLAKIITAHVHFKRGYVHFSFFKKLFIFFSLPFMPFNNLIFSYIKKYNGKESNFYATIFGANRLRNSFIKKDIFSDTILLDFEGRKSPCPIGYDTYLKIRYGDYMQIPSREQQLKRMHQPNLMLNNRVSE